MRVIFIGFMGSGKTTVSKIFARDHQLKHLELDELILEKSGRGSINEIFETQGESHFRQLETSCAQEIRTFTGVISCGGGIGETPASIEALRQPGTCFVFLETSFEEVCRRLDGVQDRPLFRNRERAFQLYQKRQPSYLTLADMVVQTDGISPQEVSRRVASLLGEAELDRMLGNRQDDAVESSSVDS